MKLTMPPDLNLLLNNQSLPPFPPAVVRFPVLCLEKLHSLSQHCVFESWTTTQTNSPNNIISPWRWNLMDRLSSSYHVQVSTPENCYVPSTHDNWLGFCLAKASIQKELHLPFWLGLLLLLLHFFTYWNAPIIPTQCCATPHSQE